MPNCINSSKRWYSGKEPSPKGFGYCAHTIRIGTRQRGRDGSMWRVTKTKTGKRWVKDEVTVFVFYTFGKGGKWKYPNSMFPAMWDYAGSGHTNPFNSQRTRKYKLAREEMFVGPSKGRKEMKQRLRKYFNALKDKHVIKEFKVENTYKPEMTKPARKLPKTGKAPLGKARVKNGRISSKPYSVSHMTETQLKTLNKLHKDAGLKPWGGFFQMMSTSKQQAAQLIKELQRKAR